MLDKRNSRNPGIYTHGLDRLKSVGDKNAYEFSQLMEGMVGNYDKLYKEYTNGLKNFLKTPQFKELEDGIEKLKEMYPYGYSLSEITDKGIIYAN